MQSNLCSTVVVCLFIFGVALFIALMVGASYRVESLTYAFIWTGGNSHKLSGYPKTEGLVWSSQMFGSLIKFSETPENRQASEVCISMDGIPVENTVTYRLLVDISGARQSIYDFGGQDDLFDQVDHVVSDAIRVACSQHDHTDWIRRRANVETSIRDHVFDRITNSSSIPVTVSQIVLKNFEPNDEVRDKLLDIAEIEQRQDVSEIDTENNIASAEVRRRERVVELSTILRAANVTAQGIINGATSLAIQRRAGVDSARLTLVQEAISQGLTPLEYIRTVGQVILTNRHLSVREQLCIEACSGDTSCIAVCFVDRASVVIQP